eukprot:SAG31_NODE_748_length_12390_cov_6.306484_11_plen_59_part_00
MGARACIEQHTLRCSNQKSRTRMCNLANGPVCSLDRLCWHPPTAHSHPLLSFEPWHDL